MRCGVRSTLVTVAHPYRVVWDKTCGCQRIVRQNEARHISGRKCSAASSGGASVKILGDVAKR